MGTKIGEGGRGTGGGIKKQRKRTGWPRAVARRGGTGQKSMNWVPLALPAQRACQPSVFFVGRSSDGASKSDAAGWHWTKEHSLGATGFASAACVLTFGVFVGRSSDGASKSDAPPLRGCIPNGASTKRRTSKKSAGWHWTKEHSLGATGFASAACVLTFGVFVGRSSDGASKSNALPLQGCIPNGASTKRGTSKKSRGSRRWLLRRRWPRIRGPA